MAAKVGKKIEQIKKKQQKSQCIYEYIPFVKCFPKKKDAARLCGKRFGVYEFLLCVLSQTTLYLIFVKLLKKEEKEKKKSRKQQKVYKKATF